MVSKRITMTLSDVHLELLERIAETMGIRAAEVAKSIVVETLDSMVMMFESDKGQEVVSNDVVLKRMFRMVLSKMIDAIEDLDNPYMK